MTNAEENCTKSGGTWNGTGCTRAQNPSTSEVNNPGKSTKNSSNQFSLTREGDMGHDSRAEGTNINYNVATSGFEINIDNKSNSNFLTNGN